jgi:uncharacterized protein
MPIFMGYAFMTDEGWAALPFAAADHATTFLTHFLVEGKFHSLFKVLFGIGFSVQLLRARHSTGRLPVFTDHAGSPSR